MEEEVIGDLEYIQEYHDFCPESPEWEEFLNKLKNPNYLECLFNIILIPQYPYNLRIIGISILLRFDVLVPPEIITQFFPLIYDENFQSLIAEFIVCSSDPQFLLQEAFPALYKDIQNQNDTKPFNGLILCFFEFVRYQRIYDENILNIIYQIIINKPDMLIDYRKKAVQTIILQMNLVDFDNAHKEVKNIVELFVNLPLIDENIALFEYLLYYIKKNISVISFNPEIENQQLLSPYDEVILQRVEEILDFIVSKTPLDPDNYYYSTALFYLLDIIKIKKLIIPFEKAFSLLIIGEKQLSYLQQDIDYFLSVIILGSDDFHDVNNYDEDYDYDNEYNEEESHKEIFDDFINDAKTLFDVQNHLLIYLGLLDEEYIISSIELCLSSINQSNYINITILRYFMIVKTNIPIVFDPEEFNWYDDPIILYFLLDFCHLRALSINKEEADSSPDLVYASFIKEFNYNECFKLMIESDDPVLVICAYGLISSAPRDLIDPYFYEITLKGALQVILYLSEAEARTSFIEHIFSSYLTRGDCLEGDNEDEYEIKYLDDPTLRRYLSESIFMFPDSIILAFKEDSQSFFEILYEIFTNLTFDAETILNLTKLLFYFAGGNINQYISRSNTEKKIVNISEYDLFFEEVSNLSFSLVSEFISDESLAYYGLYIFAKSFLNICYPEDEKYLTFIDEVYQLFIDDDFSSIRNSLSPEIFDLILRIFIKNEKYLNIDHLCEQFCYRNPMILNEKWKAQMNIKFLVYELSFVIINKHKIYSNDSVKSIFNYLIRVFISQIKVRGNFTVFDFDVLSSVGIILARLSLSCTKEEFEMIMNSRPIQRDRSTVEVILHFYFEEICERFTEYSELVQKMIIFMYYVHSDNEHAQHLLALLVNHICEKFDSENFEALYSMDMTYGLTKEDIFYDDDDFLSHPMVSASICYLIRLIGEDPIDQTTSDLFEHFLENYPNL